MSIQYCFDIINPQNQPIDNDELKEFVKSLYVGYDDTKFRPDEKIPLFTVFASVDNSVCVVITRKGRGPNNNYNRVETINQRFQGTKIPWKNGIFLTHPYLFQQQLTNKWEELKIGKKGKRWESLIQRGPYFTEIFMPYKPFGSSIIYDDIEYPLTPLEEKIAGYYAKRMIAENAGGTAASSEWTKDEVFNINYWNDFKKYLTPEHKNIFHDFSKIDWSPLIERIEADKSAEMSDDEKMNKKAQVEEKKRDYGYAILDGRKEKVGNFTIEPQGIFYGRGKNPNRGRVKANIEPNMVTLNVGPNDPVPEPPPGHKWAGVVTDQNAVWLAKWRDSITGQTKYVKFSDEGKFKGESDIEKYEKARKLQMYINTVRERYMVYSSSDNPIKMQLGTVLYLIDHFGVRIGNERDEDEADTVGASTLRVEHLKLNPPDSVIFDFLGKDSIQFYKELKVPAQIYSNFQKLLTGKKGESQVFDKITSSNINTYLKEFDSSFSAKVFRTRLASSIMYEALEKVKIPSNSTKARTKQLFGVANKKVAEILNHTRSVSNKTLQSVQKKKDTLAKLQLEVQQLQQVGRPMGKVLERIERLEIDIASKTDVMTVAMNTSLKNYIDPRIIVSWAKEQNVDLTFIYTPALIRLFQWAIQTTDADWDWMTAELLGNQELEPSESEGTAVLLTAGEKRTRKESTPIIKPVPVFVSQKSTILLLGDSILDNFLWNDVETNTTAETLRKMGYRVIDRTTGRITASRFFNNPNGIEIEKYYVDARDGKNIPYDGYMDGNIFRVLPVPSKDNTEWWGMTRENKHIVLSLGGNDFVLDKNLDLNSIKSKVSYIINILIQQTRINPRNLTYIIAYPPNTGLSQLLNNAGYQPKKFYQEYLRIAKNMCNELGVSCLSLEDFTHVEKGPDDSPIPYPTKAGAMEIARRIGTIVEQGINPTVGGGTIKDYETLLEICAEPRRNASKFTTVSKEAMDWIYPFAKYALDKIASGFGEKINLQANEYIVKYYTAAYIKDKPLPPRTHPINHQPKRVAVGEKPLEVSRTLTRDAFLINVMTVAELKEYCSEKKIPCPKSGKKNDILKSIIEYYQK